MRQQKEQQMLDIIHNLENDQYYAAKVVNTDTNAELGNNLTGQKMISDFGSVEGFFKYLISKGINRITVHPKRKNGSTFVFKGDPIVFQISDSNDYQRELQPVAKPLQQTPEPLQQNMSVSYPQPAPTGLNAPEYSAQQAVLNQSPQLAYLADQSPDFLQYITGICHAINTLPGFYDELNQLIEKYQTNASNDTNTGN